MIFIYGALLLIVVASFTYWLGYKDGRGDSLYIDEMLNPKPKDDDVTVDFCHTEEAPPHAEELTKTNWEWNKK